MVFSDLSTLQPEVDYQALIAQLPGHSHPRRKLKELQTKGHLIRVKKGFYVFNKSFIGKDYSKEIVANLLYGPSYISLEYALSTYNLIPEKVEALTCVTTQKNKFFSTPIGPYQYRHLTNSLYHIGFNSHQTPDGRNYLIASPEKALIDLFSLNFKNTDRPNIKDIRPSLEGDLRVDLNQLARLQRKETLQALQPLHKNRPWTNYLIKFLLEEL